MNVIRKAYMVFLLSGIERNGIIVTNYEMYMYNQIMKNFARLPYSFLKLSFC